MATSRMTCLALMARKIMVSQSTSGDVPESGLDALNQDGDSVEVPWHGSWSLPELCVHAGGPLGCRLFFLVTDSFRPISGAREKHCRR